MTNHYFFHFWHCDISKTLGICNEFGLGCFDLVELWYRDFGKRAVIFPLHFLFFDRKSSKFRQIVIFFIFRQLRRMVGPRSTRVLSRKHGFCLNSGFAIRNSPFHFFYENSDFCVQTAFRGFGHQNRFGNHFVHSIRVKVIREPTEKKLHGLCGHFEAISVQISPECARAY